jgi:hypothetical protein
MTDANDYRHRGHGVLSDNLGSPARPLFSILGVNNRVLPLQPWLGLAAISRDAPVKDAPVTLTNPFDFSASPLGVLVNQFLWHHLLFNPRPLSSNSFFKSDSNRVPDSTSFEPVPMNPLEGAPILPQEFR